jgi:hypothetical protein
MSIRYLGLARIKGEEDETMAISLTSIQNELLPGLRNVYGRKSGLRIESYVEFESDSLVIKAEVEPGGWTVMKITRHLIEDGKHIAMLRNFLESVMCGSKGSVPMSSKQAAELARYQQLAQQQFGQGLNAVSPYNQGFPYSQGLSGYNQGLGESFAALKRQVIGDNLYKEEFAAPQTSVPQITAKELTKEELKERLARKLDLAEAGATDPVEVINLGRWRQIMEETFKDDDKGGDHAKRTEAGSNGGRKRGDGAGGDDA